jgi:hypothetical protein
VLRNGVHLFKPVESEIAKATGETTACERCGSFEAMEIAGKFLCTDCVALAGCGCAGEN